MSVAAYLFLLCTVLVPDESVSYYVQNVTMCNYVDGCHLKLNDELEGLFFRNNKPGQRTFVKSSSGWGTCIDQEITCDPESPFRTFDGTCNNLENPTWGMAGGILVRLALPFYRDDKSSPRRALDGSTLPSSRKISRLIFPDRTVKSSKQTVLLSAMAQFLAHETLFASQSKTSSGRRPKCCKDDMSDEDVCMPIMVEDREDAFRVEGKRCISFTRAEPVFFSSCSSKFREQSASVTHSLDLSAVYGSSESENIELRTHTDGLMETSIVDGDEYLPFDESSTCGRRSKCMRAGDARANQNAPLSVLHTVFLRNHNSHARFLKNADASLSDEIIFQTARKINIAQFQHTIYSEFLPLVLGNELMEEMLLQPLKSGFTLYDSSVNLACINSFAGAAFRAFHTIIPSTVSKFNLPKSSKCPTQRTRVGFNNGLEETNLLVGKSNFDQALMGAVLQQRDEFDRFVSSEFTTFLFGDGSVGMDLIAADINRGRDNGLPPYNVFRQICGLPRINSFQELGEIVGLEVSLELDNLYFSIDDVDLYVGSILEQPMEGALFGPTLGCIMGEQSFRWKFGDRFWYEHEGVFTEGELSEIRKTTMASIFCQNGNKIERMTRNPYLRGCRKGNNFVNCDALPTADLSMFL